jgi:hypothetical protein
MSQRGGVLPSWPVLGSAVLRKATCGAPVAQTRPQSHRQSRGALLAPSILCSCNVGRQRVLPTACIRSIPRPLPAWTPLFALEVPSRARAQTVATASRPSPRVATKARCHCFSHHRVMGELLFLGCIRQGKASIQHMRSNCAGRRCWGIVVLRLAAYAARGALLAARS